MYQTALKKESTQKEVSKVNLLRDAKTIRCSGEINEKEIALFATDGNLQTKWCDINSAPHFIDFDLGSNQTISGWKLVSAGIESPSYITRSCFLQGKNNIDEEWKTIDSFENNNKNTIVRNCQPTTARYLRLLVTQPTQRNGENATRIYEIEVYK